MLIPSVAALTSVTGNQSCAAADNASDCMYAPSVTPTTACAARKLQPGGFSPACGRASANASPTTSAANSVGDGKPTALSASAKLAVAAPSPSHGAAFRI